MRRGSINQCAFPSESASRPQLEATATSTTFSQPLMRAVGGAGKQAANREGKAAGQRQKQSNVNQSQERVKSGVIKTVGKAGPEGKLSIKASINGLNSHACAHPTPYVFTHINYPQGLPPFFHCSPRIDEKINPTDPRSKRVGILPRPVCGHLTAIRSCFLGSRRKADNAALPGYRKTEDPGAPRGNGHQGPLSP